jgi:hypothetical protein
MVLKKPDSIQNLASEEGDEKLRKMTALFQCPLRLHCLSFIIAPITQNSLEEFPYYLTFTGVTIQLVFSEKTKYFFLVS